MTYNRGGIMFYKVAECCSLIMGFKGWRDVLFRKILCSCFKTNDIRRAEEARRALRPFRSVREFSVANCRGMEETR